MNDQELSDSISKFKTPLIEAARAINDAARIMQENLERFAASVTQVLNQVVFTDKKICELTIRRYQIKKQLASNVFLKLKYLFLEHRWKARLYELERYGTSLKFYEEW
jgi:hypothetical protein